MVIVSSRVFARLAPLFVAVLVGCISAPLGTAPTPAPSSAPRPTVMLPFSQSDRGVQIVLPDTVLIQVSKAYLNADESGPYLDLSPIS